VKPSEIENSVLMNKLADRSSISQNDSIWAIKNQLSSKHQVSLPQIDNIPSKDS
jgi:hypothetical protein